MLNPITGNPLGPTDQRSQIKTFNIAPTWTHLIGIGCRAYIGRAGCGTTNITITRALILSTTWGRFRTKPSPKPGPDQRRASRSCFLRQGDSQPEDWIHRPNTPILNENDTFRNRRSRPASGSRPTATLLVRREPIDAPCYGAAPYDLTAGEQPLQLHAATPTLSSMAFYARGHHHRRDLGRLTSGFAGISTTASTALPGRPSPVAASPTTSKRRIPSSEFPTRERMESPFNENLILTGIGCNDPVVNAIMTVAQGFVCTTAPLTPGFRNEFHAGLQQAFGKYFRSERRVHLEVHAQRLRLQCLRHQPDYSSDRMGEV